MPRKPHQAPPAYCLHKASGKAVVRINKQDHYLGLYGTPESHAEYERLIAEFRVAQEEHVQQRNAEVAAAGFTLTLSQVLKRYREFAQGYYVKDGKPTKELVEMRYALRPLRKLYGNTLAREPAGISSAWMASHPNIQEIAASQEKSLDRWDLDAMRTQLTEQGATEAELQALDAIFAWGEQYGDCDFQASGKASFVIRIPTCGDEVRILTIQGRKLRFYWGHFIGGYDETKRPNRNCKKFPHAYDLAENYCQRLNAEFGWSLEVLQPGDGFCEPSRPLADVSEPALLSRFLAILGNVAAKAKTP